MPMSGDHPWFIKNHVDALTNVLQMYHGLSRFLKSYHDFLNRGRSGRKLVIVLYNTIFEWRKRGMPYLLTDMN